MAQIHCNGRDGTRGDKSSTQSRILQPSVSTDRTTVLLKPSGLVAHNIDPMILFNKWAHHLEIENKSTNKQRMIFAGIGKPSYLLNDDLVHGALNYWQTYANKLDKIKKAISDAGDKLSTDQKCDLIANESAVIDYGLPAGDTTARSIMAQGLNKWYGSALNIQPSDILFTVGGAGALRMIFNVLHERTPSGRIITPCPYYPLYHHKGQKNNLHFVDVMKEPSFKLTAKALKQSIEAANQLALVDGKPISGFLFCDPNNPLGTVIDESELKKIAEVLKTTSNTIPIILDEAYAEMVFHSKRHLSLLQIAPELKDRMLVLRSGTKGFSASGERMAVVLCFNPDLFDALENEIALTNLHSTISSQMSYAQGMLGLTDGKRQELCDYYQLQVAFVQKRLEAMNARLPSDQYQVQGTFYVIANLSRLFGSPIPREALRALGVREVVQTDEDICYTLLFGDQVMLMPLSYFGVQAELGWVRITCSGGIRLLSELMDRIERRLQLHHIRSRL